MPIGGDRMAIPAAVGLKQLSSRFVVDFGTDSIPAMFVQSGESPDLPQREAAIHV
jgi:hypothetical protein